MEFVEHDGWILRDVGMLDSEHLSHLSDDREILTVAFAEILIPPRVERVPALVRAISPLAEMVDLFLFAMNAKH